MATMGRCGEVLYNGITLPDAWPPHLDALTAEPLPVPPYLASPPEVIPIDMGRQLLVDDFLVERTTLSRTYHNATYHPASPVLMPDRPWENEGGHPCAMPFSDGVWYDPAEGLFRMWYMGGYCAATCYATSRDGIHWVKPELDVVPGTNIVLQGTRDSNTVWPDPDEADPTERFKMVQFANDGDWRLGMRCSSDGIHWSTAQPCPSFGDRGTFFFNPFRNVWVQSLRADCPGVGRCRRYFESRDAFGWCGYAGAPPTYWVGADSLDPVRPELGTPPQLYNLDCVAYESVLLGLFSIWYGQPQDRPKPNEICVGFSRDGFHWWRPSREAFIGVSERRGDWNWGNVQSAGGCLLVVGDELWFYVSGRAGVEGSAGSGVCSTGLAVLRRDGFCSMDAPAYVTGELLTRPVTFGGRHLFVNLAAPDGSLRVEVTDVDGSALPGFSAEECVPVRGDSTRAEVRWTTSGNLSALAGGPVRFRFLLRGGSLYSFWVSADERGTSRGYLGAGGPGYASRVDE